ncbi:hypothetical protein BQ8794_10191 [Mesorhizobium prunaredense]|uniref:Uncharacterized protein n=1 Tax=Mesorhizobium prunaredense TaxID=1631249 RepID=A0A1R3UYV1_9HYPH|nr:hypothetical protein [Mesorhizobium prunaredense]SIT52821.1 hypothetical protein BQ8794_10191 [Mesorhizobium prunaredense]
MKVRYLNAPAGSGKSYQAISTHAVHLALHGERVVIAMPTKQVISETMGRLDLSGNNVRIFSVVSETDHDTTSVASRLVCKLREPSSGGEIVFITHAGLMLLPYAGQLDWHLIVDEAPTIHSSIDPLIDDELRQLANAGDFHPSPFEGLRTFKLSNHPEKVLTFPRDSENRGKIHELAWAAFSKHSLVLVPDASAQTLSSSDLEIRRFQAFSLVTPRLVERFESVLMLSANFQNTLPFQLWTKHGARFVEDQNLASGLRFRKHDGSRATISYVAERDWSKQLQDRPLQDGSGCTIHARIVEKISQFFESRPFLWVGNKRFGNLFSANENAERLPSVSHGLNAYHHFNNVVFLSALNPSPAEFSYFKQLGLTEKQAKAARFHEAVYQGVMRCSLRTQDDSRPVQIIVMDRATAIYLHELLPGSTLQKLDWIPIGDTIKKSAGRPKKHVDPAARKRASRSRQRAIKAHDCLVSQANALVLSDHFASNGGHEIPIESIGQNVTKWFWGMQFQTITAAIANDSFWFETPDGFVADLQRMAGQRITSKDERSLISPAYFNPDKVEETDRGNANIEFLRGIWLDNDGGGIPPDEVPKLFPGLQVVIFNSFNSTKACPRYRVFIPTTAVFGLQTHDTIINEIWSRFHEAGYEADTSDQCGDGRRFHGFDRSKKSASSVFYLPSQAADPCGNIFLSCNASDRKPLEPRDWIRRYHREPEILIEKAVGDETDPSVNWAKVEAAKAAWRNSPKTPGSGNGHFFKLGLKLQAAGMSLTEIEVQLHQEAIFARSPMKRRRRIPSIISSLKIYTMDQKTRKAA